MKGPGCLRLLKTFFAWWAGAVFWLVLPPAMAENYEQDLQMWPTLNIRKNLGNRYFVVLEANPRIGDNLGEFRLLEVVPSVGRQITDRMTVQTGYKLWLGYGQEDNPLRVEHRLWQESSNRFQWKKLTLTNRARLEERFMEGVDGVAMRFRDRLQVSYPLGEAGRWYLLASDEIFVNLNSPENGPHAGYGQNRAFAGLGRKLGRHASVEGGYQLQHTERPQAPDALTHAILMRLNLSF